MSNDAGRLKETEVRTLRLDYLCECGGAVRRADFQPYIDGNQYECTKCLNVLSLEGHYPRIIYREATAAPPPTQETEQ